MDQTRSEGQHDWLGHPHIRPYVMARPATLGRLPARVASDWFTTAPLLIDPLASESVPFAEALLELDAGAYGRSGMGMARWVFYDCALLPGVVTGFVIHRSAAPPAWLAYLNDAPGLEWIPLSMFIAIPTVAPGEWVAHNLASANALLPDADRLYGLGFLSKALGLWFAGVRLVYGVAQWASPAVRLHAYFGEFEIVGAYTPLHSHPATLTYRARVDLGRAAEFFAASTRARTPAAADPATDLVDAGFVVDPKDAESLKSFQRRLEERSARYYLNANQIRTGALDAALNVYKRTHNEGY